MLFARVVADGEATQLLYVVPPLGFFCQTLPDLIQGLPIKHIKEFNGEHIKLIEVMIVQILPTLEKVKSFKPTYYMYYTNKCTSKYSAQSQTRANKSTDLYL